MGVILPCPSNLTSLTLLYPKRCSIKSHLYQLYLLIRVTRAVKRWQRTSILREVISICQIYLLRVSMLLHTEGSLYLSKICIGLQKLSIFWKKTLHKGNVSIFSVLSLIWGQLSPYLAISTAIYTVKIFWKISCQPTMNIFLPWSVW